jgi:hypothetical protein
MTWRAISARPIGSHVIDTHFEPSFRFFSLTASYDATCDICQAVIHGLSEGNVGQLRERASKRRRDDGRGAHSSASHFNLSFFSH